MSSYNTFRLEIHSTFDAQIKQSQIIALSAKKSVRRKLRAAKNLTAINPTAKKPTAKNLAAKNLTAKIPSAVVWRYAWRN